MVSEQVTATLNSLSSLQIVGLAAQGLVAKSVPGLTSDQVFIVDGMGNTLNSLESGQAGLASNQLELENNVSDTYKKQIEKMLEPVIGVGKVVVGVRVSLDFDKKVTEKTTYSPVTGKSGIAASESKETAADGQSSGVVGQDANGGSANTYPETTSGNGQYEKSNKTTNYEINKINETLEKNQGSISDMSVSIILDNTDLASGTDQKVKDIVAGATGVNPNKVTVQAMEFNAKNSIDDVFANVNQSKKQEAKRNAIVYGLLAFALFIIIIVLLVRHKDKEEEEIYQKFENVLPRPAGLTGPDEEDEEITDEFKVKRNEKRAVIENTIDNNPEFITQLLRNWLDEDK